MYLPTKDCTCSLVIRPRMYWIRINSYIGRHPHHGQHGALQGGQALLSGRNETRTGKIIVRNFFCGFGSRAVLVKNIVLYLHLLHSPPCLQRLSVHSQRSGSKPTGSGNFEFYRGRRGDRKYPPHQVIIER